ncbi:MAG: DNA topoisomerase [Thermoprotei archaeon]|nr:MAG: DNA topoisomerase [Thermoprotei archaeon]
MSTRYEVAKRSVLEKLSELGMNVYRQMARGRLPKVYLPSRSTSNIIYDERSKQYVLGSEHVERSAANIRHVKSFTQLLWVGWFASQLIKEGKSCSLRDLYYTSLNFPEFRFKSQKESDDIVTDLESVLGVPREDFKISPEERSSIFGDLTIEYTVPPSHAGKRVNLLSDPDGKNIGMSIATAEFIECNAEMVIVIEKGAIFRRFIEERVYERFKAILIDSAGQAPRFTRLLLRRLNEELGLPVYILTDADPWGMHIANVIIHGSANAAHIKGLTTPTAKWLGLWATDLLKYRKLPTLPMNERDLKRLRELKKDPRYRDSFWQREIDTFLKLQRKAELESFSAQGLSAIVDKYLPKKLKEVGG